MQRETELELERNRRSRKWRSHQQAFVLLVAVAAGFVVRGWSEPLLWAGWFAGLAGVVALYGASNVAQRRVEALERTDTQRNDNGRA